MTEVTLGIPKGTGLTDLVQNQPLFVQIGMLAGDGYSKNKIGSILVNRCKAQVQAED